MTTEQPTGKIQPGPHVFALITLCMWALKAPFVRGATQSFSSLPLSLFRCIVACGVMLLFGIIRKIGLPRLRDLPYFFFVGGLINAAYMFFNTLGLVTIPASTASVIAATSPVVIVLLAGALYKESIGFGRLAAMGVEFSGIVLIALLSGGLAANVGLLYLVVSSLCYAVYSLLQRRPRGYNSVQFTTYSLFCSTAILMVQFPLLMREMAAAKPLHILMVVLSGVLCTGVANITWALALSRAKRAGDVANYIFLSPFATSAMGYLINGEAPYRATWIGGGVVMLGAAAFHFFERSGKRQKPAAGSD